MAHSAEKGQSGVPQPDLNELARKLLDLWQDHLTAVAADPELTAQMLRLLVANPAQAGFQVPGGASAWFQNPWAQSFWGAMGPGGASFGANSARSGANQEADGTSTRATTPDVGPITLGKFRDRLANLEKRLAAIEGGNAGAAKGKPRKSAKSSARSRARPRKAR